MCAFLAKLLDVPTEPQGKPFQDPVFLIGLMRSGTTLLMNTLSEHPQLLKAGFELNDVWSDIGGAPCSVNCAERTEKDFSPEYANNMTAYFTKYIEESKSIKRHLARYSAKRHHGSGGIFYDWENIRVMNKSPHLSNKIRYIHKIYPKAKFVVIIRSLEGQVSSMKMHFKKHRKQNDYTFYLPKKETECWSNIQGEVAPKFESDRLYPGNFALLLEAWLRLNTRIIEDIESIPNSQKHILLFEDLMENQDQKLMDIFGFLDLEQKHKFKVDQIISKKRKIHNTTTKGNPLDKWKKYLEETEQKILQEFKASNKASIERVYDFARNFS